jgi:hypothetical protein
LHNGLIGAAKPPAPSDRTISGVRWLGKSFGGVRLALSGEGGLALYLALIAKPETGLD